MKLCCSSSRRLPGGGASGWNGVEAGSVLALVPAGFMILIVLAALAINSAVAYRAREQLHDVLLAAANDGAAAGLSGTSFYSTGALVLAPRLVDREVCSSISAQGAPGLVVKAVSVSVAGLWVQVTASAVTHGIFAQGVPGVGRIVVSSTATAVVADSPVVSTGPGAFGAPQPLTC